MDASARRIDCTATTAPVGYHRFHADVSLNFQCNRWVQWIGPTAVGEVAQLAAHADTYPEWIAGFLGLAEQARAGDRSFAAAYYDRAAEFFMTADDARRGAARARFLQTMRAAYDVAPEHIPFDSGALPAYDLRPERQIGATIVMFGGFDSYIEEFFPMIAAMVDAGRRIVVFDGPGQGGALEDNRLPMTPDWLKGRQPKLTVKQQNELRRMHGTGDYTISDLAELFKVSRPTVYRTIQREPAPQTR